MCPTTPVVTKDLAATDKNATEPGHVVTAGPPPESTSDSEDGDAGSTSSGFAPMPNRSSPSSCSDDNSCQDGHCADSSSDEEAGNKGSTFSAEETVFIFDWDDTLLPSTWLQRQGLRLDGGSKVSKWQREQLAAVASTATELLNNAKQCGTVVLVTNAERGWIELSCQKFMPTLLPQLESIKALSARTTFEGPDAPSPLEWKLRAFESEIKRIYGAEKLHCANSQKNVLSLGDSVHEREALLRATRPLPNCRSKSLKFVERPDISQIVKQHELVISCFEKIVHYDGSLDTCIKCT